LRSKTGCICVDYNTHTQATAMGAYFHVPVEQAPNKWNSNTLICPQSI